VLFLALMLAPAASAQPYLRTAVRGNPTLCIYWPQRAVTYHFHSAGSARTPGITEFTALRKSYASWQAVSDSCSNFQLNEGAMLGSVTVGYDETSSNNQNVVTFRDKACDGTVPAGDPCYATKSCDDKYECWDNGPLTIALTTITYSTSSGQIRDADIEFNGPEFLFTTVDSPKCVAGAEATTCVATDIENTMTHELGHFIGLDHVDTAGSTMESTAALGELKKRTIDLGSKQGFCVIYPADRGSPAVCDDLTANGQTIVAVNKGTPGLAQLGCAATAGPVALLGALAAAAWALRRKR
jgi:hypothetical protein